MNMRTPPASGPVLLPRMLVNRVLTLAQSKSEEEICGLIGAVFVQDQLHPEQVWPIRNVAHERGHLFQMDPTEQIDALRQMREQGRVLFAIYHSHPHAPAVPSQRDADEAAYPDALYLIISLNTKGVLEMQGYRLDPSEKKFHSVALEVIED
jgi:proteasome lid subunit RPN8/RPN11